MLLSGFLPGPHEILTISIQDPFLSVPSSFLSSIPALILSFPIWYNLHRSATWPTALKVNCGSRFLRHFRNYNHIKCYKMKGVNLASVLRGPSHVAVWPDRLWKARRLLEQVPGRIFKGTKTNLKSIETRNKWRLKI